MHAGLSWFRHRQRALTRAALALFVLAWLQMAALPCVMAHAPATASDASEHCGYCPDASDAPGAGSDQCEFPHDPGVDARYTGGMFIAPPSAHTVLPVDAAPGEPLSLRGPDSERYRAPPLTLRYCRLIE